MRCDHCGERPAAIHLTQIVNNAVTQVHLCEPCAAEKGIHTNASIAKFPLSDFLASLGKAAPKTDAGTEAGEPCSFCGATLANFRETGRLGCPHCYTTFDHHLRDLLRRLHGSSQHVGEVYLPPGKQVAGSAQTLLELRDQLRRAVEAENFELAAELRDRIRVLE
ncbi:MAG TPA: UvrB/UvrC motif-containing protein [Gemmatimonadales bacterium]|nr:UvrB/UvrC motif-containing protein [Gemmatimonadales bacterium]